MTYDFIKPELDADRIVESAVQDTLAIDPNASHAEIAGRYTISGNPELVCIKETDSPVYGHEIQ